MSSRSDRRERSGAAGDADALYGAVEAGGTKFVLALARGREILESTRIPTTTPERTLGGAVDWFRETAAGRPLAAVGVGSFGPVDLDPASATFGSITSTPKPHWSGVDIAGAFAGAFEVPVGFDTDVNAAALGELLHGAGQGLSDLVYLTIGTGIGGGMVCGGRLVHGLIHPEMGHLLLARDPVRDPFPGACPFHGDCFEGLAAGPALEKRWKTPGEALPPEHPAWDLEAHYIAMALASIVMIVSPQRIILGGGVMARDGLFGPIRRKLLERLAGYVRSPAILSEVESFVVPPGLGSRSGLTGALELARRARNG